MRSISSIICLVVQLSLVLHQSCTDAFSPSRLNVSNSVRNNNSPKLTHLYETEIDSEESSSVDDAKVSLEEKLKSWEATEEEVKAASLGGLTPNKVDGFDLGLYIMFPFMVATGVLFGIFPFIMDKIDVSSVGPPPMV